MLWTVRRNPLVYPLGRRPGFDPNHVASKGRLLFSAIGSPIQCLFGGDRLPDPTWSGNPVNDVDSFLGPCRRYNRASLTQFDQFNNVDQTVQIGNNNNIVGLIFTQLNTNTGSPIITWGTNAGGPSFAIGLGFFNATLSFFWGGGGQSTFTDVVLNHPMFVGMSGNANPNSVMNVVIRDLATGQYLLKARNTAIGSGGGIVSDGHCVIGGDNPNQIPANGTTNGMKFGAFMLAAGTGSNNFLSLEDLITWAEDPWSYWYPRIPMPYYRAPTLYKLRPDGDVAIGNWTRG